MRFSVVGFLLVALSSCISPAGGSLSAGDSDGSVSLEAFEPWSADHTRQDLVAKSVERAHMFFDREQEASNVVNLFLDNALSEERRVKVADLATTSVAVFGTYAYPETDVVIGKYPEFMRQTVETEGIAHRGNFQICGYELSEEYVSGCAFRNAFWFGFGNQSDDYISIYEIVPHEIFHTVQNNLDSRLSHSDAGVPAWFMEGTADFFGYAIFDYAEIGNYAVFTEDYWYYLPDPEIGLKSYETRSIGQVPPEYYWMGQIATEYIVANVGVEPLLQILEATGEGTPFPDAFESRLGISLEDFYLKFDQMYEELFDKNVEITTYVDRKCPDEWFCEDGPPGEWWQMLGVAFPLPEIAENTDHGVPVSADRIDPPFASCKQMPLEFQSGVAASHLAIAETGEDVPVSSQWYAQNHRLDTNIDGIACGPGDDS